MDKVLPLLFGLHCALMIQGLTGERNFGREGTPDLICIGFGTTGCRITCDVLTQMYNVPTQSICNLREKCVCRTKGTLSTLWKKNFQEDQISKRLLYQILKKSQLSEEVREILRDFPRSPQEYLKELIDEFPKRANFKELQPKQVSYPLDHYADRSDLRETIGEAFKKINLPSKKLRNIDYVDHITQFIELEAEDEVYKKAVHEQLCQVDNEFTKQILNEHFSDKTCDSVHSEDNTKPYERLMRENVIFVTKELTKSSTDKNNR